MTNTELASFLDAAGSTDLETVATFHHEARKAYFAAAFALDYSDAAARALYAEETRRVADLPRTLEGWAAYRKARRVGSAYRMSRQLRKATFALVACNEALAAVG